MDCSIQGNKKFQSLSGFQVRCNLIFYPNFGFRHPWFQSLSGFQVRCNFEYYFCYSIWTFKFQSLSGFQVRCNNDRVPATGSIRHCFNPYRVFKFVATFLDSLCRFHCHTVSIPIGFSSSLQLQTWIGAAILRPCFNPYRVFKFVATQPLSQIWSMEMSFNPYRVFKFVAT